MARTPQEPVWNRNRILPRLVAERGVKTTGFRKAMHQLVKDHVIANWLDIDAECNTDLQGEEEPLTIEEQINFDIDEFFGDIRYVPAAYKITPVEADDSFQLGVEVDIYEFEFAGRVPDWKLSVYGDIADREGVLVNLHIIDRFGYERIIKNDQLMCLAFADPSDAIWREILANAKTSQIDITPMIYTTKKQERAILEAVYEMGLIKPEELNKK